MAKKASKDRSAKTVRANQNFGIRSRIVIAGLLATGLIVGCGGWAAQAKLSGAIIAQGRVAVKKQVKQIQHRDGGIVGAILVDEWRYGEGRRRPHPPRRDADQGGTRHPSLASLGIRRPPCASQGRTGWCRGSRLRERLCDGRRDCGHRRGRAAAVPGQSRDAQCPTRSAEVPDRAVRGTDPRPGSRSAPRMAPKARSSPRT